jgi:hypothetical protein
LGLRADNKLNGNKARERERVANVFLTNLNIRYRGLRGRLSGTSLFHIIFASVISTAHSLAAFPPSPRLAQKAKKNAKEIIQLVCLYTRRGILIYIMRHGRQYSTLTDTKMEPANCGIQNVFHPTNRRLVSHRLDPENVSGEATSQININGPVSLE